jgi:fimbrial chaperone protein
MHLSLKSKRIEKSFLSMLVFSLIAMCCVPGESRGGTFAARVSPPNFELKAKPGDVLREVITIENSDTEPAVYQIRTADWDLNDQGGVIIYPADKPLASSSCRPWTRIERRTLKLAQNQVKKYRVEVHVPENAEDGEWRFAVVISPDPKTLDAMKFGMLKMPIAGSIAVIVYLAVGDARPDLEIIAAKRKETDGNKIPVVRLHNIGNAHARPFGSVMAEDADKKKAELILVPFPILPGQTTDVKLGVDPEISGIQKIEELVFPVRLKGLIEWDGGTYQLDSVME